MTTIFVNGGAPDYIGEVFQTSGEILDKLETYLVSAGWTLVTKVAASSLLMRGNSLNDHKCYVSFEVVDSGGVKGLNIRGFHDVDLITGSPNSAYVMQYQENNVNRFWLAADEDSACLCIFGSHNTSSTGIHFGFLNRIDPTDPWAWMIGWIHGWGHVYAYVAKSKHDSTSWRRLGDVFYEGTSPWSYLSCIPGTTFDALTRGKPYYEYDNNTSYNPYYYPHRGRLNYNGLPLIDKYCYVEGRGNTSDYATTGVRLSYRGYVKYAYCGVSYLGSCIKVNDPLTGNVILSVGDQDWQGMRIL
jgi:hypothetical protein